MSFFDTQNPGIGGIDELTPAEEGFLTSFAASASVGGNGTILKSNGSLWVASTETYAVPGTSGNVLTSNGTNWTSAAPSGGAAITYNETPAGLVNGSNQIFTTASAFTTGKTMLYLNGMRQKLGAGNDYTETGASEITFISTPQTGDELIIDYS